MFYAPRVLLARMSMTIIMPSYWSLLHLEVVLDLSSLASGQYLRAAQLLLRAHSVLRSNNTVPRQCLLRTQLQV